MEPQMYDPAYVLIILLIIAPLLISPIILPMIPWNRRDERAWRSRAADRVLEKLSGKPIADLDDAFLQRWLPLRLFVFGVMIAGGKRLRSKTHLLLPGKVALEVIPLLVDKDGADIRAC